MSKKQAGMPNSAVEQSRTQRGTRQRVKKYVLSSRWMCFLELKRWVLADLRNGYLYAMQVYTGKKDGASLNTALNIALFRTSLAICRGKIITYFVTLFSPLSHWLKICLPRICICVELRLRTEQISLLIWNQTSRKWKHFVTGIQFFGRKRTLWQLSGRTRSLFLLIVR